MRGLAADGRAPCSGRAVHPGFPNLWPNCRTADRVTRPRLLAPSVPCGDRGPGGPGRPAAPGPHAGTDVPGPGPCRNLGRRSPPISGPRSTSWGCTADDCDFTGNAVRSDPARRAQEESADPGRVGGGRWGRAGFGPVHDDHPYLRHRGDAPADRRADRLRMPDRPRRLPDPGRRRRARRHREEVADPGDRRHPLPAEVRLRGDRQPAVPRSGSTRATSSSSTTRSARSPRRPTRPARPSGSASTRAPSTSACSRSTARPRPRRWSSRPCGRRRSSRSTAFTTSRSR